MIILINIVNKPMNKKEEEKFDEDFKNWIDDSILNDSAKFIKNWITEHDQRERDRLIEDIYKQIKMISFGKFPNQDQIVYKEAYNNLVLKVWEIINNYKNNE